MRRCSPPRAKIAAVIVAALRAGNKLLIIGNGGSAADAQHIAAEIIGRYKKERPGYAAIALTTDTSALTAIANDYGFEQVFARQVDRPRPARRRAAGAIDLRAFAEHPGGATHRAGTRASSPSASPAPRAKHSASFAIICSSSPSDDTPVVQQIHLTVAHGICDEIEQAMMRGAAGK